MTDQAQVIEATAAYVKERLYGEGSGHDWWHIYRVWRNTIRIGEQAGADLFTAQLAALLHDIADWKFHDGDETVGPRLAGEWLAEQGVAQDIIVHVQAIIAGISFKGEAEAPAALSVEGQVVQDADRLDAIGAIGIARTFAYGGHKGAPLYDPDHPYQPGMTAAQYKSTVSTPVNHFYEKLLLLKDRMNTAAARQMAEQRHAVMEDFLAQFFAEWDAADGAE